MRKDQVVSAVLGEEITLSPSDLYNAKLKTCLFGGYSKNQVDILLERAADLLERLVNRLRAMKQQVEEQKAALEKFRDMEASLRTALISSQKMSENMIISARLQADAILEEARLARARAVFQIEELPEALHAEIRSLKEERERLRTDIAAVIRSHRALLDRIPRAESTAETIATPETKTHFVALHEEGESDDFRFRLDAAEDEDDAQE